MREYSGCTGSWLAAASSGAPSPEEQAQASEQAERVDEALEVLTPQELSVIRKLYFGGHDKGEVAREMFNSRKWDGVNELEASALAKLRELLDEDE